MPSHQCTYTSLQGQQTCSYPIREGSPQNFCIFHDPAEKKEEEIQKLLKEKVQKGDFNFEGYVFTESCNFREVVFLEFANFENCQFLGRETSFYRASFKKGALFNNALFRGGKVNFSRAQFAGDFNLFNGASFEALELNFFATHFSGKHIGFASAKFSGYRLDFKEAQFYGGVFFNQCQFGSQTTSFEKMRFNGEAISFSESRFEGKEFNFSEARLTGDKIDFSQAHFENDQVLFDQIVFEARQILFSNATFKNYKASYLQSRFTFDELNFTHAAFNAHEIDFSESIFERGTADFSYAFFQAKSLKFYPITLNNTATNFTRCEFSGDEKTVFILNPQKNDLSFQGVFFHGGKTKLKGDLHAASFIDTSLDNVDLGEALWETLSGRLVCRDEIDADRAGMADHYKKAVDVCRNIKQCYENYGDYDTAGDFYYGEMESKRKLSPRKNLGGLQFMRFTSGYGERPVRVIFTSLFIIIGCAFLYLFGGVTTPAGLIKIESTEEFSQFPKIVYDFLNCIYFSVVSFTTLGYGDYHPAGWSRVVGASEGFIGAFFMAMFVLTVGRKMNR